MPNKSRFFVISLLDYEVQSSFGCFVVFVSSSSRLRFTEDEGPLWLPWSAETTDKVDVGMRLGETSSIEATFSVVLSFRKDGGVATNSDDSA